MKKKSNNISNSHIKKNSKSQFKKNQKHKISPLCFNKCVEWDLMISFSQNKTTYSNVRIILLIYIFRI